MSADGAGFTEQPLRPARASDAPISARNCRRLTRIGPDGGLLGELRRSSLLKGLAVGQFLEAAPVRLALRRDRAAAASVRLDRDLSCGSSVACRATGEACGILDVVLLDELAPQFELIAGRLVLHVEHFLARANLLLPDCDGNRGTIPSAASAPGT